LGLERRPPGDLAVTQGSYIKTVYTFKMLQYNDLLA